MVTLRVSKIHSCWFRRSVIVLGYPILGAIWMAFCALFFPVWGAYQAVRGVVVLTQSARKVW